MAITCVLALEISLGPDHTTVIERKWVAGCDSSARSQAAAIAGALALEKLAWARVHAMDIVTESTRHGDLRAVQQDGAAREHNAHEEHRGE